MIRMCSLLAAAILLGAPLSSTDAAADQTRPVISIDPHSDIGGDWYDTRRKVKVTITGDVATITEISTSQRFPRPYVLGARVGILRPGQYQSDRQEYKYGGECIDPHGTDNKMMPDCTAQRLIAYTDNAGRVHYELDLWLLKLKRRADFSQSEWDARR